MNTLINMLLALVMSMLTGTSADSSPTDKEVLQATHCQHYQESFINQKIINHEQPAVLK
ncbi:hypothetical protein [Altibacter sp. HG106]|uniref:hypothetical protein n=1 Tax=Altibacter sp. HG106 TaxID=3023937 RepID=UPI002350AC81|nr:hypothetical protein [Altibacter sp. HG106]MDC7993849.1 hypothetical protein [Altibacter sp. HG106]